jgi:hypothetical protein
MLRPVLLCVLALALPAFAGCVEQPAPAVVLESAPAPAAPFVRTFAVVDPAGGTGEPSFGVAPDGTLFANGAGGRGGAVYRSTDNGTTWERVATPVEPMLNADPDLAVDVDGTVWFSALWIGCSSVATSQDLGETWASTPAACTAPVADRQYVIPTEGGEAYIYAHQLPTFWQMGGKTTDYGRTWLPTGPVETPDHHLLVNEGSGWGGGGFWNRATGSVFFTWTYSEGGILSGAWSPGFAVTRDGGASWEMGHAKSMGGAQLGLGLVVGAADEAGNVYLAWGEDDAGDVGIWLAVSTDDGATWGEPVRVDVGEGSDVFPTLAAGPEGKVAIAYYENDEKGSPSDVKGGWNVTLAWTDDALSPTPTFQHANLTGSPVKKGPICINGTSCDADREFADYFQAHALPDGRVGAIFNSLLFPGSEKTLVEVFAMTEEAILAPVDAGSQGEARE